MYIQNHCTVRVGLVKEVNEREGGTLHLEEVSGSEADWRVRLEGTEVTHAVVDRHTGGERYTCRGMCNSKVNKLVKSNTPVSSFIFTNINEYKKQ